VDETGCRRWIGFGLVGLVVVGGSLLTVGYLAATFVLASSVTKVKIARPTARSLPPARQT
jgi:hypothetical protein